MSRTPFIFGALALLAAAACGRESAAPQRASGPAVSAALQGAARCDAPVTISDKTVTVAPSGGEDTANLQCAIDAAIGLGAGAEVVLEAGVYRTAQLVANGFAGTLRGRSAASTILTNVAQPLPVGPGDFMNAAPSASNPWPTLVAFVGGDVTVRDLAVRIHGDAPTAGWSIYGLPTIYALAHAFVVLGDTASASFEGIGIEGKRSIASLAGYNIFNGIFYEGNIFDGETFPPITGRFSVRGSSISRVGSVAPVANATGADVAIEGNRIQDVLIGGEVSDFDGDYRFAGNDVNAVIGVVAYDVGGPPPAITGMSGRFEIVRNTFRATAVAIDFANAAGFGDATFTAASSCDVTGNRYVPPGAVVELGACPAVP